MNTDTASAYWNTRWASEEGRQSWLTPEPEVEALAARLVARGARTALDLGCGVGRHALMLARQGFEVSALDAAPDGLAELARVAAAEALPIRIAQGQMTDLPYEDGAFDYVLSFNVIYHGDREIVARSIAEIARVLRPGGTFQGTMLSKRNAQFGVGQEVAPDTWVDGEGAVSDKGHPHFYCTAAEMLALFDGFEPLELADRVHSRPGSWHWHLVMERA